MRQAQAIALAATLAAMLASAGAAAQSGAQATVDGDPARWHQGDPTRQARMQTLQKEIGAAYAEAKNACRESAAAERPACLKQARATYEQDMKNAPAQLDAAPKGSVTTTRQVTTTPPVSN